MVNTRMRAAGSHCECALRFNAAESRHGEIHDDEVGPCLLEQAVGFGAVARLGHNLQPRLLLQQRAIAFPSIA